MHLNHPTIPRPLAWATAALLAVLAGCNGGMDPVLGTPPVGAAPTVTLSVPLNMVPPLTDVATGTPVSVTFSQPMLASSITPTSFSLACPAGAPVTASVSYNAETQVATLVPAAALPFDTLCVATVSTAVQDAGGVPLVSPFVWDFRTTAALAVDTTRPSVVVTAPADGASNVATNAAVTASFSEAMNPATVNDSSFTVFNTTLGSAVPGSVAYDGGSRTARFVPTAPGGFSAGQLHTVTLSTALTDSAGNALAGNTAVLPAAGAQVWTFTTGATGDTTAPTVTAVSPAENSSGLCLATAVSASFSEPMDAASITAASFFVTAAGVPVPGVVSYDAATRVASFVPSAAAGFAPNQAYVVSVEGGTAGVKDLAGNALAADRIWAFAVGSQPCLAPVALGAAASFGAFGGGAGVTNQGLQTVVGGNLGTTAACTLVTGFHDAAAVYTETPLNVGVVNGSIQCAPPAPGTAASLSVATRARNDAQTAYNSLAALPPGSDPGAGQLGGLTLAPGVYTAAGGTWAVTSADLVLDAQGDANAVWVFQSASSLTVGLPATPRQVRVINGGRAANVFWQVGSAARIEDGSTLLGTVIAPAGVTFSTPGQTIQTTLIGRAIGLTASVTLVNTTVVAP
jgi:hypothetical protein